MDRIDLVVGGHRWDPPPERAPDDVAAARLSEILPEIRTLGAELNARVVGARRGSGGGPRELARAHRRLDRDREVRQLRARLDALRQEQRALRGLPSRYTGIWLYRQVSERP